MRYAPISRAERLRRGEHRLAFCALLIVTAAICARGLAPPSLFRDDAWVTLVRRAPLTSALRMGVTAPGFGVLLREWLAVAGFSELRAQLPAYLAAVLAPPMLYLLAVRMRLRQETALLAAVLLATSIPFVNVAVRVKPYSVGVLGVVVLMWLGWRVAEEPARASRWAALTAAAVLLTVVTATVVGAVVAAFAIGFVAAGQAGQLFRRHVVGAAASYAVFLVVWWLTVLSSATTPSLKVSFGGAMIPTHPGQSRWGGIYARLSDLVGHFTPLTLHHAGAALLVLAAAILIATERHGRMLLLTIIPLVVAVVLALEKVAPLGGATNITVNGSRVDVYLYPSLALLFAAGLEDLLVFASELRLAHRLVAPAAALTATLALVVTASSSAYPQEDVKPLVSLADAAIGPGTSVVVQTDARYQYALYTRWPVSMVFSDRFESRFTVNVHNPSVSVMGGGSVEDGNSDSAVFGLVPAVPPPPPPTTERVVVVTSRFYSASTGVDKWLSASGYQKVSTQERPGAGLEFWLRT
jgi:4-amino-4-deoxy-L-arabinose transferase-like glycosyltransferase